MGQPQEKRKCDKATRPAWKRGRTKRVKKAARARRWARVMAKARFRRADRLVRRVWRRLEKAKSEPQKERLRLREIDPIAERRRAAA